MHLMFIVLLVWAGILPFNRSALQSGGDVVLSSPVEGQILQGVVIVEGIVSGSDLATWDLQFGYLDDTTDTWFTLSTSDRPVENGQIAAWDTTQITDGDYRLRVVIHFVDGSSQEVQVSGLQVRNYSPLQSSETADQPALEPTAIPSLMAVKSSPTAILEPNPGAIDQDQLMKSGLIGAGIVIIAFVTLGIYYAVRNERMRRS